MRLFVAAWPPEPVRERLRALPRPALDGARWVPEERWHVTLRFLGEVAEAGPVVDALRAVGRDLPRPTATLGGEVVRLGPAAVVPVAGVDELAGRVVAATAHLGRAPDDRPFRGHVTVARGRGRRRVPPAALGPVPGVGAGTWVVDEVALVRSHLGDDHRYEALATVTLGP